MKYHAVFLLLSAFLCSVGMMNAVRNESSLKNSANTGNKKCTLSNEKTTKKEEKKQKKKNGRRDLWKQCKSDLDEFFSDHK